MRCIILWFILIHLLLLNDIKPASTGSPMNMTVIHTNDLHGRFGEVDQNSFICDTAELKEKKCFGGVARLATAIKMVRNREENVVLLDGGDRFSGSIWTEVYRGNATRTFVNKLNYTAVTLGNHEFDLGLPDLLRFLEGTKFAVVVSNVNTSLEPSWPNNKQFVDKRKVFDLGGQKVGIVGYIVTTTGRTSNSGPNIQFLPIVKSVQEAVTELTSRGVTKIIAVGHAGFEIDKEIARKVQGVDIVVGGHSNTFLFTGDAPSIEKPEGPYPYIINPDYNQSLSVPVVQAFAYSKYLGHLQVTFNEEGHVTSWHGNPILMDHKVRKDPDVDNVVKKMKVLVDRKGEMVIGQSKVKLDASDKVCVRQECELGNVLTAAMLYHFKSHNATIAVFPGNSIKASLPTDAQGNVFYKDLFRSFSSRKTIDLVELSGGDFMESLKAPGLLQSIGFLQVKGLRIKYSPRNSGDRRVEQIEVQSFPCTSNKCYQPMKISEIYKFVLSSSFAGYNEVIAKKRRSRIRGDSIYEVIVNYFKDNSPITTEVNTGVKVKQTYVLLPLIVACSILTTFA